MSAAEGELLQKGERGQKPLALEIENNHHPPHLSATMQSTPTAGSYCEIRIGGYCI